MKLRVQSKSRGNGRARTRVRKVGCCSSRMWHHFNTTFQLHLGWHPTAERLQLLASWAATHHFTTAPPPR